MDDLGRYSPSERRSYVPPPCPNCGSTDIAVSWSDATTGADPQPANYFAVPGSMRCRQCGNAWE